MNYRHIASFVAFASAILAALQAYAGEPRAVIELFTSQGCSSCPAADKVLGDLAHDPSLVTLSLPVDYWDYLGWKDTLALHGHSMRQRAYAESRGDREVYTPQVVVNGIVHVLGSDKAAIESAIAHTQRDDAPLTVPVILAIADGKVTVTLPDGKDAQGSAEVWLCPITSKVPVEIARGENHGRTLTYTNVVRRWVRLGEWSGKAESFSVPLSEVSGEEIDKMVVVVQSGVPAKPGLMLGAAVASIH
jgi:hypothetical protein